MMKRLAWMLAAALVAAPLLPAAPTASAAPAAAPPQGLEQLAAEKAKLLTEQYGTVSVQYALIDQGRIVVSGQSGRNDEKGKIPLSADTMYGTGSVSKMFTAAAVMKLVDEGKIDLDAPLVQYLPDFKMKDERYKQITPRMLLNHSSGLPGSSLNNAFLFEDADAYAHDTLLQQLSTQSLKADPGAFSVYCNDGFTLAELLVERVSGVDYTAFIHQHFTGPLGMDHTKTPQDGVDPKGMAGLYFPSLARQLPNETVNVFGTGGIYSTAEDLARFSQLFTDEEQGLLSAEAVEAMEQPEYERGLWPEEADNSIGYGLGWDSVRLYPFDDYGIQALTKGGDTIFYHGSLVVLPEQDMAAAVLSSGGSSSTNQLLANQILLKALKDKGTIDEIRPDKSFGKPVAAPLPAELKKQAGYYGTSGQLAKIELKGSGLSVTLPGLPEYPAEKYIYTADGTFMDEAGTAKVEFVKETNGQTYLWVRQYLSVPGLGQTALSHYTVQKLASNPLPKETASAWAKREGKAYYPLNEKYTSMLYVLNGKLDIRRAADFRGYAGDKKITGPDAAISALRIPGMSGRDTAEFRFYRQDGAEFLETAGLRYIREDAVKPLHLGKQSKVTVKEDGYARWFHIPAAAAGKTMSVKLPAAGGFTVYDAAGGLAASSVASGTSTVVLPAGGTIVFAGEPGAAFSVSLSKK
ncbi:beta-lactamase family protein [Paenibacillus albicereus]|uniref:Beta-lactamase family protein n=1 Tax=Paenibacillus albicereus TaxID=2726185 RepID=A0A6H2H0D6_9BACL|nr:serine hydrolase domain-containing protein [Paenibacillus albicereus]QJC53151.1 beta-lactamase family protein [Paenibacillus albicereus]